MRAIQLSHGHLLPTKGPKEAGGQVDLNAARVMDGFDAIRIAWERRGTDFHNRPWTTMTASAQQRLSTQRWARQTIFAGFGNTAVYPPFLYVPAIAGWRLGEAADLTVIESLRLARLLSALCSVLLGWLALRIATAMRLPLFVLLLLPSTLFLNACCSQDALLVSVAAVATALLGRAFSEGRTPSPRELVVLAVLLAIIALARPPYLALGLLLLLAPVLSGARPKRWWLQPVIAFAAVLAATLLWRHLVAGFGLDTADEADPVRQLGFVRAHPLAAGAAVLRGTGTAAADLMRRGLYVLGWNDLLAPWPLRATEAVLLLLGLFPRKPAKASATALILFSCATALLGISLAEYVIWTPPGLATVYGVQPRYWLPVLPFLALLTAGRCSSTRWLLPAAGLSVAVAASLPAVAARMFYGEGLLRVLRLNLW